MPDYFKWSQTGGGNASSKFNMRMIGIFAVIALIFAIPVTILFSKNTQDTRQHAQTPPASPSLSPASGMQSAQEVESCQVHKQGNPLVKRFDIIDSVVVGQFTGTITSITSGTSSVAVTVQSLAGSQQHTFTIPTTIDAYDAAKLQLTDVHALKTGETVVISFNCFPKQNNTFKITAIGIGTL